MTDPIVPLAELAAGVRYDDLPERAVAAAKTFILDTLGVGIAGRTGPRVAELAAAVAGWGAADESTAWGFGRKLPAASAAILNAYQIHALEFDCVHEPAVVHPMATLFSALLAHAERRGARGRPVSGRDLVRATAVGVEIACTIGAAAKSPMRFFRPATAGGFGVVAGIGAMEGLDVETLLNAFGILYGQTAGTLQPHLEGSMVLPLQLGFNARAGLTAVDLAMAGLTGPRAVLAGTYGYYRLFEPESDVAAAWAALGKTWQVTRLSHKPFPSGRLTHAAIDAVQRARRERDFDADEVAAVRGWMPPLAHRLVGRPDVPAPTVNYAKLCTAFVVASELAHRAVVPESFAPERLADPALHALAARVAVEQSDHPDPNALWPQRFVIALRDGWTWDSTIDAAIGHPDNPLSHEAHLAKFRRCCGVGRGAASARLADELIAAVDALDRVPDVGALAAHLA